MSDTPAAARPAPAPPPPVEIDLPVGTEKRRFTLQRLPDGDWLLPSATTLPDGRPRFHMPLPPRAMGTDQAISYLARHELLNDGYERGTREVIDAHLRPGDLFLDIGAHWGTMAFAAATRWPHNVRVMAFEAHPENAARLFKGVAVNKLQQQIEVFACAVGARTALAPIAFNTTMGHGLLPTLGRSRAAGILQVPVMAIDEILSKRSDLDQRPVVVKIDVEGLEPEVIAGMAKLIASGRVKLIIWEKGRDFFIAESRKAYDGMVAELTRAGYSHFSFPWQDWAGVLTPDLPDTGTYNVYSFSKTEARLPHYQLRFATLPSYNPGMHTRRARRAIACSPVRPCASAPATVHAGRTRRASAKEPRHGQRSPRRTSARVRWCSISAVACRPCAVDCRRGYVTRRPTSSRDRPIATSPTSISTSTMSMSYSRRPRPTRAATTGSPRSSCASSCTNCRGSSSARARARPASS